MEPRKHTLFALNLDSAYLLDPLTGKTYRVEARSLMGSIDRINSEHSKICRKFRLLLASDEALCHKRSLEDHLMYTPREVHLADAERSAGLLPAVSQMGQIPSRKEFKSLHESLYYLYGYWKKLYSNPDAVKGVLALEKKAKENAERSIDSWIKGLFNGIKA